MHKLAVPRQVKGYRHQCGQSLVEVCVACIALVPLAIGLVYVGQYIHVKQTVQQAAREAAWDATVAPSTYKVQSPDSMTEQVRLRARYFGNPDTAIEQDTPAPDAFSDSLLEDYSGQSLLDVKDLTLTVYTNEQTPGVEGDVDKTLESITGVFANAFSKLGINKDGSAFPPDTEGYITARVNAGTAKAKRFSPFDKFDLGFNSQTVLLADAWNADGGGENDATGTFDANGVPMRQRTVRSSITYLAPFTAATGGALGGILKMVGWISKIPIVNDFFPSLDKLQWGRTAPDVVPYDKLQPYKK